MFKGLDHVAVVVPDTEEALRVWRDRVGLPYLYTEVVNGGTVRLTHLDLGNTQLQLVEPLTLDHPLKTWLGKNGPGLHHLCMKVENTEKAKEEAVSRGIGTAPAMHQGTGGKRALFLDRKDTQNVQVEVTGA
jgi:methylmalonyl-CoA/ethylmalonyl-CoA epimerase